MDFALKIMDFALKMTSFVLKMMNLCRLTNVQNLKLAGNQFTRLPGPTCTGSDDGTGTPCTLNAGLSACNVVTAACVFEEPLASLSLCASLDVKGNRLTGALPSLAGMIRLAR